MNNVVTQNPATVLFPVVAAALIDGDGRVLVQRRPPGKMMADLWEFPGGKIEPGETPEAALIRELCEELGIAVTTSTITPAAFASEALAGKHLLLLLYLCREWAGTPRALDATEIRWVTPDEMYELEMPPADLPLVDLLKRLL